jgi:hypothetical protein
VLEFPGLPLTLRPGSARFGAGPAFWLKLCALTVLLAGSTAAAQEAGGLRVVPLVRNDQVLVSFRLTDGYTDEVRAAVRSGLKTSFTYTIDLRQDVPVWTDRTIATATLVSSVVYDTLEKRFTILRTINGRDETSRKTEDEGEVRELLTNMVQLSLFKTRTLIPNREYYVRVAATARPTNGVLLWPFGSGTSAQTKFTFIR